MEDVKQKAKELILDSPVSRMVPEEKIDEVFSNIVLVETQEELLQLYRKFNGNPAMASQGKISAFTNGATLYMGQEENVEKFIHNIVHEVLHRLSKKWDKNGNVIQNGMQCNGNQNFANQTNEGITDYLTKRIVGGNYCQYVHQAGVIEALDREMIRYFDDPDVLFSMYLEDDNSGPENKRFKEFLDGTKGKGSYDELYETISYMNKEKAEEYVAKVHKGVNRYIRKRNIKRVIGKIKNIFIKPEKQEVLTDGKVTTQSEMAESVSGKNIIGTLHEQVNDNCEVYPPRVQEAKDDLQL